MKKYLLIVLLFPVLFICCRSQKDKTEERIKELMTKQIILPYSKMSCWINDSIQKRRPWEKAQMKLIVYTDSSNCSECALKTMYMWEDFVKLEKEYNSRFSLVFIFQTRQNIKPQSLASLFRITELNHPMYIDSCSIFSKSNSHLPRESMYHIFLLDNKNNVVLVGSPLFNSKIEGLLRKEINKQLGKKIKAIDIL